MRTSGTDARGSIRTPRVRAVPEIAFTVTGDSAPATTGRDAAREVVYRNPGHRALPHVVKFSGGRSSAMLLFCLLENRVLDAARGDVIVFNNTSAEHPDTYELKAVLRDMGAASRTDERSGAGRTGHRPVRKDDTFRDQGPAHELQRALIRRHGRHVVHAPPPASVETRQSRGVPRSLCNITAATDLPAALARAERAPAEREDGLPDHALHPGTTNQRRPGAPRETRPTVVDSTTGRTDHRRNRTGASEPVLDTAVNPTEPECGTKHSPNGNRRFSTTSGSTRGSGACLRPAPSSRAASRSPPVPPVVAYHLQALKRKGWIQVNPGMARGIQLLREGTPVFDPDQLPEVAAGTPSLADESKAIMRVPDELCRQIQDVTATQTSSRT